MENINKLYTKNETYFINLDRSTERLKTFLQINAHLKSAIRSPAVEGSKLGRDKLASEGYIEANLPYGPGALGCAMSHLKLWEIAAERNISVTIFEDDAVVSINFEKRSREVIGMLPVDWDIIHWGIVLNPLFVWIDAGVSKAKLHHYGDKQYIGEEGIKKFQSEEPAAFPVRLLHSFGMHGYTISAKGARSALDYCVPLRKRLIQFPEANVSTEDEGIDVALCGWYPNAKAFLCMPQLVITSEQQSSVISEIGRF